MPTQAAPAAEAETLQTLGGGAEQRRAPEVAAGGERRGAEGGRVQANQAGGGRGTRWGVWGMAARGGGGKRGAEGVGGGQVNEMLDRPRFQAFRGGR